MRKYHHAGITGRHLHGVFVMPQNLIFTAGHIMMIAVTAKFKQHQPANDVITVPAVVRHGTFIQSAAALASAEAIMFNIVYTL